MIEGDQERLCALRNAFYVESQRPQGNDSRYAACSAALYDMLDPSNNPTVREVFTDVISWRRHPHENSSYLVYLTERVLHMMALDRKETLHYPHEAVTKEWWQGFISETLDADGDQLGNFMLHMTARDVQTNIGQRALAQLLVPIFFSERIGVNPQIADVGSSEMQGLKSLFMQESPFQPIFIDAHRGKDPDDQQASEKLLNSVIRRAPQWYHPGLSIGIDKTYTPPGETRDWDRNRQKWVKTNSIRPDDMVERPHIEALYDRIAAFETPDIVPVAMDFSEPLELPLPGRPGDERYDMVFYSSSLYQNSPEGVRTMIDNGLKIVKPLGLLAVLDFVRPDARQPRDLHFVSRRPYSFRLLLLDPQAPDEGWKAFITAQDGRFRNLTFHRQWKQIRGAGLPFG
jgi:hypothetical protein